MQAYIPPLLVWLHIMVRDAIGTTWVLAATVTIPFASILNGPVVNGVVCIGCNCGCYVTMSSLFNTFNAVTAVLLEITLPMDRLRHLLDLKLLYVAIAVLQFAGMTFNPVEGLASHSSYYCITSAWSVSCKR
jgi:hypothetical protein